MSDPLQLAEEFVERMWNRGDMNVVDDMLSEDYVDHTLPDSDAGDRETLKDDVQSLRDAMPDLHIEIEDSYQDEDFVILRSVASGEQRGELFGVPPAGKRAEWDTIDILRFDGDAIVERWAVSDTFSILQQLGGIASPEVSDPTREALVEQLAESPRQFRATLRDQMIRTPQRGEASASAILGHLWQTESAVWQTQLGQVARQENPLWEEPVEVAADWIADFDATDINLLLDAFEFRRSQTCAYLRGLTEDGWARQARYQDENLDIAGLVQIILAHDSRHHAALSGAEL